MNRGHRCRTSWPGARRSGLLAALLLALTAGAGSPAAAQSGTTACTPGVRTVGGAQVRTFCGPARATAKAGGKTFRFSGGQCAISRGIFTVNIGTVTITRVEPKFSYLGIDAQPPKAGAHHNQIVSWQVPGKGYSIISATVTIAAGLRSGTFSGRLLTGGVASGSFTCS